MEWNITFFEEQKYVEVVTSGVADRDGSLSMAKEVGMASRQRKIKKILIDHRSISAVSGGTIDVYSRPAEFKNMNVVPGIMVAEVVKPEHKEFFKFLELVCSNRGFNFSVFNDKESALQWLLKS